MQAVVAVHSAVYVSTPSSRTQPRSPLPPQQSDLARLPATCPYHQQGAHAYRHHRSSWLGIAPCFVPPNVSSGLIRPEIGAHPAECVLAGHILPSGACSQSSRVQITSGIPFALKPDCCSWLRSSAKPSDFGILMTVNPHYRRRNGPRTVKRPNASGQAITVNRAVEPPIITPRPSPTTTSSGGACRPCGG